MPEHRGVRECRQFWEPLSRCLSGGRADWASAFKVLGTSCLSAPGAETRALKLLAVGRFRVSFGERSGKGYRRELSGVEGLSKSLLAWVDPHEGYMSHYRAIPCLV